MRRKRKMAKFRKDNVKVFEQYAEEVTPAYDDTYLDGDISPEELNEIEESDILETAEEVQESVNGDTEKLKAMADIAKSVYDAVSDEEISELMNKARNFAKSVSDKKAFKKAKTVLQKTGKVIRNLDDRTDNCLIGGMAFGLVVEMLKKKK